MIRNTSCAMGGSLAASVTIYLAMTFMCIVSLVFALLESAHTAGNSYYLQNAANAATDSVFSEYDNTLWNYYRLFLYNMDSQLITELDFEAYAEPYVWSDNYFRLAEIDAVLDKTVSITAEGGYWFEEEILDYMKTGVIESQIESETGGVKKLWEDMEDAQEMQETAEAYSSVSRLAVELENIVASIDTNLKEQKTYRDAMVKALAKGKVSTFRSRSSSLLTRMRSLPGLVQSYKNKEASIRTALASANSKNKGRFPELTEMYADYVYDMRSRGEEIDATDNQMSYFISEIKWAREEVSERQKEAREADPPEKAEYDDIADELEWCIDIPELDVEYGIGDRNTESIIEKVSSVISGNMLQLVLPAGKTVSTSWMPQGGLPSKCNVSSRSKSDRGALEKLEIAMYASDYYADFTDYGNFGKLDEDIKAQRLNGEVCYELEYILGDNKGDRENLCTCAKKVWALREGLNYLHIMRNASMRSEAEELAAVIVGSAGMPALIPLVAAMIIAAWAAAESAADVRTLLDDGEIPFVKKESDWQLDLDGMLSLGRSGRLAGTTTVSESANSGQRGLSSARDTDTKHDPDWETYLKYLIMTLKSSDRNYRMMDVIQNSMQRAKAGYLIKNGMYALEFTVTARARHLFAIGGEYEITKQTAKAY